MSELYEKITKPLIVKKKIAETPEAYSFQLEIPPELKEDFRYSAGQFVTLFLRVENEMISRSYSLCTSPAADNDFQITVKRVPMGKGSNYLADKVNEGDTLLVTPPQGQFYSPGDETQTAYFLFAAGSGITPIYSILKETLTTSADSKVFLFYSNRNEESVIYKDQLTHLQEEFSSRLQVTHMFSKPMKARLTLVGRCSSIVAKKYLLENLEGIQSKQAYLCGPNGFMEQVKTGLASAGFEPNEIRIESFGAPLSELESKTEQDEIDLNDQTVIGDDSQLATPEKIIAVINGETVEVDANPNSSVLESLIEAGQSPPYSCMNGACMACMAKIVQGRVAQEDPGILTEENIEAQEALTCQAKPLTATVKVDYDDF